MRGLFTEVNMDSFVMADNRPEGVQWIGFNSWEQEVRREQKQRWSKPLRRAPWGRALGFSWALTWTRLEGMAVRIHTYSPRCPRHRTAAWLEGRRHGSCQHTFLLTKTWKWQAGSALLTRWGWFYKNWSYQKWFPSLSHFPQFLHSCKFTVFPIPSVHFLQVYCVRSAVPKKVIKETCQSHSTRQKEKFYFCRRGQPQTLV